MATQKPKKARTDTTASTGLALPSAQPAAAAATPTTTPYRYDQSISCKKKQQYQQLIPTYQLHQLQLQIGRSKQPQAI
ncbi:hypothetical protein FRC00_010943 [Tulasnella sp. 408]|nr:hypothetical protein FRC00_010943 [Tulasnella sp. 408]